MKELNKETIYNEKYDITVNRNLTAEQIGNIVSAMSKCDNYADRIISRDLMVLAYCTDIGAEKIDEIGHDAFTLSGLIEDVKWQIDNYEEIEKGIAWQESMGVALNRLARQMPELSKKIDEIKNNASSK